MLVILYRAGQTTHVLLVKLFLPCEEVRRHVSLPVLRAVPCLRCVSSGEFCAAALAAKRKAGSQELREPTRDVGTFAPRANPPWATEFT